MMMTKNPDDPNAYDLTYRRGLNVTGIDFTIEQSIDSGATWTAVNQLHVIDSETATYYVIKVTAPTGGLTGVLFRLVVTQFP